MFRFTLGIPGFNDALLPRVVGIFGAALLIANHLSDQGAATPAQVGSHRSTFTYPLCSVTERSWLHDGAGGTFNRSK